MKGLSQEGTKGLVCLRKITEMTKGVPQASLVYYEVLEAKRSTKKKARMRKDTEALSKCEYREKVGAGMLAVRCKPLRTVE